MHGGNGYVSSNLVQLPSTDVCCIPISLRYDRWEWPLIYLKVFLDKRGAYKPDYTVSFEPAQAPFTHSINSLACVSFRIASANLVIVAPGCIQHASRPSPSFSATKNSVNLNIKYFEVL